MTVPALAQVKEIVAEFLDVQPETILDEHCLAEDLGCDDLAIHEIAREIEIIFEIDFDEREFEDLQDKTVVEVAESVESKLHLCWSKER